MYKPLQNLQHWEIIKLMAEGEQFYVHTFKDYTVATETDVAAGFAIYKEEIIDWRSKLDDTIENSVLCYVWNATEKDRKVNFVKDHNTSDNGHYPYKTIDNIYWFRAKPVEQELVSKILGNTIDAIREEEQKQEQSL